MDLSLGFSRLQKNLKGETKEFFLLKSRKAGRGGPKYILTQIKKNIKGGQRKMIFAD
jgi:hypothetical protein